jgi:hypothetical protein
MPKEYLKLFKDGFDDTISSRRAYENYPFVGYDVVSGEVAFTVIPKPVADGPWVTFTAEEANSTIGL